MPPTSKHARLLADLPAARKALTTLRQHGDPGLAAEVKKVFDYAEQQANQAIADQASESGVPNHSLAVDRGVKARIIAAAEAEGASLPDIISKSLQDFIDGTWTPEPPARAARNSGPDKVRISVRVRADLWDQADQAAKDPKAVAARGYRLTATTVAIAALMEWLGTEETATA